MATAAILAWFPNPITWAFDKGKGFVGGVAAQGFEMIIGGLTAWMLDAVVWVVGGVFRFFLEATDPNVQADWFLRNDGPYATTAGIGAVLLVGFVLVGITQGVLAGDVGGMLRRVAFELPMAVIGMVGLVTVTQALVALTDALSDGLFSKFGQDGERFVATVTSLSVLGGGTATAFIVFLLALVSVLAGIVLVAELVVRSALIYIVVALAPLVFAAQLWPALRGAGRKLLEMLVALIVSKLVIAVALAVAAAAAVGAGSGGEVTALEAPEVVAEDPGGSVAQAVGILLAATAAFGVAAFSPLLVARLLPITEAAVVASGIRGGPVRAGQQAMSLRYYTQMGSRSRLSSLAGAPGPAPGGAGVGNGALNGARPTGAGGAGAARGASGGAAAGGSAAAGGVAAAGVAVAGAVNGAARRGASAATATAEASRSSTSPNGTARPPARPGRRSSTPGPNGGGQGGSNGQRA